MVTVEVTDEILHYVIDTLDGFFLNRALEKYRRDLDEYRRDRAFELSVSVDDDRFVPMTDLGEAGA